MAEPRVFVSSVIDGFQPYREAARKGIKAAGGEPVLVNEDFPSLPKSFRNACLDAVVSSDIYLAIIGERAGWRAPSGKLVVVELGSAFRRPNSACQKAEGLARTARERSVGQIDASDIE